jgi:uncharacterized protein (TIGR03382 family)
MRKIMALWALCTAAGAAHAQIWVEVGDAPSTLPGQITLGIGPLTDIVGTLGAPGDVDLYCIFIHDPAAFGAWTESAFPPGALGPAGAAFDTQLWLFDHMGFGVLHGDDSGLSTLSGIGAVPVPLVGPPPVILPGYYWLGISGYNTDPLNPAGSLIWLNTPFISQRVPDGPGAPGPLSGWTGTSGTGDYHIVLSGASFCDVPAPGALGLAGLAALAALRRRR